MGVEDEVQLLLRWRLPHLLHLNHLKALISLQSTLQLTARIRDKIHWTQPLSSLPIPTRFLTLPWRHETLHPGHCLEMLARLTVSPGGEEIVGVFYAERYHSKFLISLLSRPRLRLQSISLRIRTDYLLGALVSFQLLHLILLPTLPPRRQRRRNHDLFILVTILKHLHILLVDLYILLEQV